MYLAKRTPYNSFAWIYTLHIIFFIESSRGAPAGDQTRPGRHGGGGRPAGELPGNSRDHNPAIARPELPHGSMPAQKRGMWQTGSGGSDSRQLSEDRGRGRPDGARCFGDLRAVALEARARGHGECGGAVGHGGDGAARRARARGEEEEEGAGARGGAGMTARSHAQGVFS